MAAYPRAWWLELIGFDRTQPDMGVGHLLDKAGFQPDAMVLLLWSNDFIHAHRSGMPDETLLRQDCASYWGRSTGLEHGRQHWRQGELKTLIRELQARGIAVYFSVFDQLMNPEAEQRFELTVPAAWTDAHPEVKFIARTGEVIPALCPWKRLADGSYYEDFFVARLRQVMLDYRFDGFHGADGYIHQRVPVYEGDFSDDMVGQSGLPAECRCDGDPAALAQRADAIWSRHRKEWIDFHCCRHREFWVKTADMLHAIDRKLIVNSIWTRDPFEARYRYGTDYRTMTEIGADAVVLEAPGTVLELENWQNPAIRPLYLFMASLLRLRAAMPGMPIWFMNGIKDTMEEYNAIEHAPMKLEAEIEALRHTFCFNGSEWRHCLDGILSCLSDAMTRSEWQWLKQRWDTAFEVPEPAGYSGATVLWSEKALDRELTAYARCHHTSSFHLHAWLLAAGAPVNAIADIGALPRLSGPVVVLNERFFPPEEQEALRRYSGPVIRCESTGELADAPRDPASWLEELPEPPIPADTLREWVAQIHAAVRVPVMKSGNGHVWSLETGGGRERLTVLNDAGYYQSTVVELPVAPVTAVGKVNSVLPIVRGETPEQLHIKLPPHGIVVVELSP